VTKSNKKIWAALWVVYIVWGSTYLAIEFTIRSMPPLLAMGLRFLTASFILGFALLLKFGIKSFRVTPRQVVSLLFLGGLLLGLGLGMVTLAQYKGVPSGIVALLISALPFWIIIFKAIEGQRVSIWSLAGIGIGFIGVAILLQPELQKPNNFEHIFWMLMVILGNIGWAFGTYVAPRLGLPKSALVVTFYQMLLGGVGMTLAGLIANENFGDFFDATFSSWAWWLFLVFIGSIAAFSSYVWLVANAPVGLLSTYAYVNPIIAVLLGVLFLGENFSTILFIGSCVVVFGVFLVVNAEARTVTKIPSSNSSKSKEKS
jgi:drug/metabolite transporter (DMT)-like permease